MSFNSGSIKLETNGRRLVALLLLFALAIYAFVDAGFPAFAVVCMVPIMVLVVIGTFRYPMACFWVLFILNYFVHFLARHHFLPNGIPMSLYNEALEIVLVFIALIVSPSKSTFSRSINIMLFAILLWCGLGALEVFNDSCGLGYNIGAWFSGFRLLCISLLWTLVVFSVFINTPERLYALLKVWAWLSLFSVFWTFNQKTFGFTASENVWLQTAGRTHILQGGTLIRYFSTFSDAANYGCNAAASAVAFMVIGITSRIKKDKIFFLLTSFAVIWGMFQSGTRTAIFCLGFGLVVFLILSKSVKIMVPSMIVFALVAFVLVFTTIGNSNQQIRRMRSAFNKDDASTETRNINQAVMKKYLADAPWGIGIGTGMDNVPSNNKFRKLSELPPDSEYVFIWIRTGVVGITVFLISMAIMFIGASWIVFFKIKNRSLMGLGAGICGAFAAMQLGGYGNQVLYQYPNGLIFFGMLAVVYTLPMIEPAWIEFEEKRLRVIQEKRLLKKEKIKNKLGLGV
jgi:hypothetical protein